MLNCLYYLLLAIVAEILFSRLDEGGIYKALESVVFIEDWLHCVAKVVFNFGF